jgi:ubiquinone/menaquinone biosynthesis C-methylase UbiE
MDLKSAVRRYPYKFFKMLMSSLEIQRYIDAHTVRMLNIGAQRNRPTGWLNIDLDPVPHVVYLDASKMAAIPKDTFDAVLCEHMIEHVPPDVGKNIIGSIYRVLKPGGVARFVTPDLERLARLITSPEGVDLRYLELFKNASAEIGLSMVGAEISAVDCVNIAFRNYGHQYIYTKNEFRGRLEQAGFTRIIDTPASDFGNTIFNGAQGHGLRVGVELNNLESFAFEASK